jgi:hypothetical protein
VRFGMVAMSIRAFCLNATRRTRARGIDYRVRGGSVEFERRAIDHRLPPIDSQ